VAADELAGPMPAEVIVGLLADFPTSLRAVADIRCREWGHYPDEPTDPAWWLDITTREAGRDHLPVTFVAHDSCGEVLGAVGLDTYDLDERRDTSPWVTGMIVRRDRRGHGIGRALMQQLERWAGEHGIRKVWVGTDLADGFYKRCGWSVQETLLSRTGRRITVLDKKLL
jgi:GNAT superfamily N-acetyltransferase